MAFGIYPLAKGVLFNWAVVSGMPAGLGLKLALCDVPFVFNAAHDTLADLAGVLYDDIDVPDYVVDVNGVLDAPDVTVLGLMPNDSFIAVVLYWAWTGGTQLFQYTTESEEQPLPIELVGTQLTVRFSPDGIFKL